MHGDRTLAFAVRLVVKAVVPVIVAYVLITFLIDPAHIDVSELRANSLLMHERPLFRDAPGDELRGALGASALLLVAAMAWAMSLGIGAGVVYGWSGNRPLKAVVWSVATVAASLPAFFWAVAVELGMIFLWLRFGFRLFPMAGYGFDDHLVLPALALGLRPAAYIFRLTAIAVEDVRHADYVRTAVAKGLGARLLLLRHVLPNVAPNIIAATVLATRGALSSLVLIEYVYIWGGAGLTFVQALGNGRLELAAALALSFAIGSALLTVAAQAAQSLVRVGA
jgi:peptide/nickel transport system permease protein